MSTIVEDVTIDVAPRVAYEQWCQIDRMPRFAGHVGDVEPRGDGASHWTVHLAGVTKEFDAQVLERLPGRRIVWCSVAGPRQSGVVEFQELGEHTTRVVATIDAAPRGLAERLAFGTGLVKRAVRRDLHRFKEYLEDGDVEFFAYWHEADEPTFWHDATAPNPAYRSTREPSLDRQELPTEPESPETRVRHDLPFRPDERREPPIHP